MDSKDFRSKIRRYSFSRVPQENEPQKNIDKMKSQFQVQLQSLIVSQNELISENPVERSHHIAEKLGLSLCTDDFQVIRFAFDEYKEKYQELEILGEGCIGLVRRVQRKLDGLFFASKIVKTNDNEIISKMVIEFQNLRKMVHINIVKVYELYVNFKDGFQSSSTVCIVMELIEGREMYTAIQSMGHYCELNARSIFVQILESIQYMHDHYCCHRDLKPNNILCTDEGEVKITDFNVSKFSSQYKEFGNILDQGTIEMWTNTGTVAFSAPEIFSGGFYNEQVDMWSAGCILFTMLSGHLPFNSELYQQHHHHIYSLNTLIDQITSANYSFSEQVWTGISREAKDLIERLLLVDPCTRLRPKDALQHQWIVGEGCLKSTLKLDCLSDLICQGKEIASPEQQMKKFRARCYLFGAGEIWRNNSIGDHGEQSVNVQSLFEELERVNQLEFMAQNSNFQK